MTTEIMTDGQAILALLEIAIKRAKLIEDHFVYCGQLDKINIAQGSRSALEDFRKDVLLIIDEEVKG